MKAMGSSDSRDTQITELDLAARLKVRAERIDALLKGLDISYEMILDDQTLGAALLTWCFLNLVPQDHPSLNDRQWGTTSIPFREKGIRKTIHDYPE